MQQRQPRLGDILDDYCTRERRLTNHAVVAMVGDEVKQTRCTTCDAEHEYKHARVPKQRRKNEPAALYVQAVGGAPKKVVHESPVVPEPEQETEPMESSSDDEIVVNAPAGDDDSVAATPVELSPSDSDDEPADEPVEDGPVHRPLIRAQLPRTDGQPPAPRPAPDFTIRQPGGRPNRFRPRNPRGGGQGFQGNRSNGNGPSYGNTRGAGPRDHGGRPPLMSHMPKRHGQQGQPGRKRSK